MPDEPLVIPGLAEARAAERNARLRAFVGVGEVVCGVPLRQITLGDFNILAQIGSPFVTASGGDPVEVARFLWFMRVGYVPRPGRNFARFMFARRLRKLVAEDCIRACHDYVDRAFFDQPGGGESKRPPHLAWVAVMVDFFAVNYGWSERDILQMPIARLWQYIRAIQLRKNPNMILFSPSDRITGEWLKKRNDERRKSNG